MADWSGQDRETPRFNAAGTRFGQSARRWPLMRAVISRQAASFSSY
jgi:hypothetical protein